MTPELSRPIRVDAIGAGPADFKKIMLEDIAKWKEAITAANIKI